MGDTTTTVSAIVGDHALDSTVMKCGIALANGHWLFEHNIELKKLTWQWHPISTNPRVPDESSNITLHVLASSKLEDIAELAQPHFQATININDDRLGTKDVSLGVSSGGWLVFKLVGPASALGMDDSNAEELAEAKKLLKQQQIEAKRALEQQQVDAKRALDKQQLEAKRALERQQDQAKRELEEQQDETRRAKTEQQRLSVELGDSQDKARAHEVTIAKLGGDKKNLTEQLGEVAKAKDKANKDLAEAQTKVVRLVGAVEDHKAQEKDALLASAGFQKSLDDCQRDLQALDVAKQGVEKKLSAAEKTNEKLETSHQVLQTLKKKLDGQVETLTGANSELVVKNDGLNAAAADLQEQIEGLQGAKEKLADDCRQLKGEQEGLVKESEKAKRAIETMKKELEEGTNDMIGLRSELFKANATMKVLAATVADEKIAREGVAQNLKTRSKELVDAVSKFNLTNGVLEELKIDLKRASERILALEGAQRQSQSYEQKAADADKEKVKRDLEVVKLKGDVQRLEREYRKQTRANEALEMTKAGLEGANTALEESFQRLEEKMDEMNDQRKRAEIAQASLEYDKAKLAETCAGLKKELSRKKEEVDDLDKKVSSAKTICSLLEKDLGDSKTDSKKLTDNLRKSKQELAKAKSELIILQRMTDTKILNLEADAEEAESRTTKLAGDLEEATERSDGLDATLKATTAKLEASERTLEGVREHVEKLESKIDKLLQRQLEYDPNRLYKQLDDEKAGRKADIERLNGVIEGEKAARASDIKRLDGLIEDEKAAHERDSKRLNGLVEDEKAINATKTETIGNLERTLAGRMADIERLKGQVANQLVQILGLQIKLDNEIAALTLEKTRCQLLQNDMERKAKEIAALTDSFKQQMWVLDNTKQQLSQCRSNLSSSYAANSNLQSSLNSEKYTSSTLRDDLRNERNSHNSTRASLKTVRVSLDKVNTQYNNLHRNASHSGCVDSSDVGKLIGHNNDKIQRYKKMADRGRGVSYFRLIQARMYRSPTFDRRGDIKFTSIEEYY